MPVVTNQRKQLGTPGAKAEPGEDVPAPKPEELFRLDSEAALEARVNAEKKKEKPNLKDEDKINGFNAGADDYLGKPFNIDELILRLRAILRRARPVEPVAELALPAAKPVENLRAYPRKTTECESRRVSPIQMR